jgi:type IX secretion system PorP/SprF family membrane protein
MKNLLYITGLIFLLLGDTFGQQDPLFNKYMFNPLIINPAYAGSREALSMVLVHRKQWVNFTGAPETQTFSIHAPLAQKSLGLGMTAMRDEIGPTSNLAVAGNIAYRLKLGRGKLSMGMRGIYFNYRFDWNKITYKDQEVHPILMSNNYNVFDVDAGIRYHDRTMYVGFAVAHLIRPSIGNTSNNPIQIDSIKYGQKFLYHYTVTAGYAYEISNNIVLKPSVLIKASQATISTMDITMSALIDRTLWFGATYRTGFGGVLMTQYDFTHQISIGFSCDFATNQLRGSQGVSYEVFARYDIPFRKSKVLSPRYF